MGSLKEVRNRIVSVNSTKQITAAMKMVSAAKLRRAQDAIVRMRPYAEKLQQILSNVSASLDSSEGKYSQQREVKKVLLVPIVSNRGLAGAFNTQVFRLMRKALSEASTQGVEVSRPAHRQKGHGCLPPQRQVFGREPAHGPRWTV
jgi:F-type H+-transporting ATPase subunit gamma